MYSTPSQTYINSVPNQNPTCSGVLHTFAFYTKRVVHVGHMIVVSSPQWPHPTAENFLICSAHNLDEGSLGRFIGLIH